MVLSSYYTKFDFKTWIFILEFLIAEANRHNYPRKQRTMTLKSQSIAQRMTRALWFNYQIEYKTAQDADPAVLTCVFKANAK